MNDLLSEFFIDGISRVIPGFIILALYPDKLFNNVYAEFQNTPILLIPGLIGAAWVIGFATERATYLFGLLLRLLLIEIYKFFQKFRKTNVKKEIGFLKNLTGVHKLDDCFSPDDLDKDLIKTFDFFKFTRRHGMKLSGERIFCRVMMVISFLTCLWPPSLSLLKGDHWPMFHDVPIYGSLGMFIFGAAWFWAAWSCYIQNREQPKPSDESQHIE